MRFAITDIETSGRSNKITEIAIFIYDAEEKKVVNKFVSLVNPEERINPYVSALTGITDDMVADAPRFFEIAKEVFEITQDCVFVAHSVGFDYNVIRSEFRELGGEFNRNKLCTIRLSRKIIPGYKSYSLGKLCKELGFGIDGRHRAWGDAEATVRLFEYLINLDSDNHIGYSLNRRNREATIPPHLSKDLFDRLPETPGVYYFHDQKGKVLYVGKARNIKNRINSHFLDHTSKKLRLKDHVHDITFQETGSELLALLIESHEIKQYFPEFNKAQKYSSNGFTICRYEGNDGLIRLTVAKRQRLVRENLANFSNMIKARTFLEKLCNDFELCPKLCGLQLTDGYCFSYQTGNCKGACAGMEGMKEYNSRVLKAIDSFALETGTYAIRQNGRSRSETGLILIRNGEYKGYAFIDNDAQLATLDDLEDILNFQKHNSDIQNILVSALKKLPQERILRFDSITVE